MFVVHSELKELVNYSTWEGEKWKTVRVWTHISGRRAVLFTKKWKTRKEASSVGEMIILWSWYNLFIIYKLLKSECDILSLFLFLRGKALFIKQYSLLCAIVVICILVLQIYFFSKSNQIILIIFQIILENKQHIYKLILLEV